MDRTGGASKSQAMKDTKHHVQEPGRNPAGNRKPMN